MSKKIVVVTITSAIVIIVAVAVVLVSYGTPTAMADSSELSAGDQAGFSEGTLEMPTADSALAAMERAAEEDRYLFVFFYKAEDEQTRSMRAVFDGVAQKVADRADAVLVDVTDPSEKAIVGKFNLSRAPMPLVLAIAPTGAVTGGFPGAFDEAKLLSAFVSPGSAKCIAALQAGKLVFLCLQNESTAMNGEAMKGVDDFKKDEKYAKATEVIVLDPGDPGEADFLKKLKVVPQGDSAVTVFMAPPGAVLAQYKGATEKDGLVKTLDDAMSKSGCGPGSAPGCCPPKK